MAASLSDSSRSGHHVTIVRKPFGVSAQGQASELFTLTNANGMRVDITNYGATIVRLLVPDRHKHAADVVLGYDSLAEYEAGRSYFGAVVGRCGNRIARGRFVLDGTEYELPTNNDPGGMPCHLHGGPEGFSTRVWQASSRVDGETATLVLSLFSPHGEMGYPGNVSAQVTYRLGRTNRLEVTYTGVTDMPTLLNLTQHTYFNLAGAGTGPITDHQLELKASRFLPTNEGQIPTGELAPVEGTPFDFTRPQAIGHQLGAHHPQVEIGHGYDHCWVFDESQSEPALGARVWDPASGRMLEVWTTEPGVQFYTGNWIAEGTVGKAGSRYGPRGGFCLETQHFPDAPNQPDFPPIVVRPGAPYRSVTEFRFGIVEDSEA